jgi:hypothetical protein
VILIDALPRSSASSADSFVIPRVIGRGCERIRVAR